MGPVTIPGSAISCLRLIRQKEEEEEDGQGRKEIIFKLNLTHMLLCLIRFPILSFCVILDILSKVWPMSSKKVNN